MMMPSVFAVFSSPTDFNRSIMVGVTPSPRASSTSGAIASRAKDHVCWHQRLAIGRHALANRHKPRLNRQAGHLTSENVVPHHRQRQASMIEIHWRLGLGDAAGHIRRQINRIEFDMGNGMKTRDPARGRLGDPPPRHLTRWAQ